MTLNYSCLNTKVVSLFCLPQMLSVTETETLAAYMKPPSRYGGGGAGGVDDSSGGPAKGFVVRDAPWNAAGNKVSLILVRTTLR